MAIRDRIWPEWEREAIGLLERHDLRGVVVIAIGRTGVVSTHTYGENKRKCGALAKWIDGFEERALSIIPFNTVFGWGNRGKPEKLPPGAEIPKGWEDFA